MSEIYLPLRLQILEQSGVKFSVCKTTLPSEMFSNKPYKYK